MLYTVCTVMLNVHVVCCTVVLRRSLFSTCRGPRPPTQRWRPCSQPDSVLPSGATSLTVTRLTTTGNLWVTSYLLSNWGALIYMYAKVNLPVDLHLERQTFTDESITPLMKMTSIISWNFQLVKVFTGLMHTKYWLNVNQLFQMLLWLTLGTPVICSKCYCD